MQKKKKPNGIIPKITKTYFNNIFEVDQGIVKLVYMNCYKEY